jgi:Tfp pilus assembly pilus retraction ATPase PilT
MNSLEIKDDFDNTVGKVLDVAIKQQDNMHDSCFLVSGMEGSGKSDFILKCIDYIDRKRNIETPINHISYQLGSFLQIFNQNLYNIEDEDTNVE